MSAWSVYGDIILDSVTVWRQKKTRVKSKNIKYKLQNGPKTEISA